MVSKIKLEYGFWFVNSGVDDTKTAKLQFPTSQQSGDLTNWNSVFIYNVLNTTLHWVGNPTRCSQCPVSPKCKQSKMIEAYNENVIIKWWRWN
jgi:hypothetical protein